MHRRFACDFIGGAKVGEHLIAGHGRLRSAASSGHRLQLDQFRSSGQYQSEEATTLSVASRGWAERHGFEASDSVH